MAICSFARPCPAQEPRPLYPHSSVRPHKFGGSKWKDNAASLPRPWAHRGKGEGGTGEAVSHTCSVNTFCDPGSASALNQWHHRETHSPHPNARTGRALLLRVQRAAKTCAGADVVHQSLTRSRTQAFSHLLCGRLALALVVQCRGAEVQTGHVLTAQFALTAERSSEACTWAQLAPSTPCAGTLGQDTVGPQYTLRTQHQRRARRMDSMCCSTHDCPSSIRRWSSKHTILEVGVILRTILEAKNGRQKKVTQKLPNNCSPRPGIPNKRRNCPKVAEKLPNTCRQVALRTEIRPKFGPN